MAAGCRSKSQTSELSRWPIAEGATAAEVEDHRRRNDRNDLMRLEADRQANSGGLEAFHDAIRGRQPVRAAAGEHDRIHPLDHRCRIQQVGLEYPAAATYVDSPDRAPRASTTVVPVSQPSRSAV